MNLLSNFQLWERKNFEDIFTKDESVTDLINYKGVFRTAPATPVILTISILLSVNIPIFPLIEDKSYIIALIE